MMHRHRRTHGALPSQQLRELIRSGFIFNAEAERITPASLDLTLSDEVYRVRGAVHMRPGERVRDLLAKLTPEKHSLDQPFVVHETYLLRLRENLRLPQGVYGFCNPKSSTGRLDLHVRVLADGVPRFDTVSPPGFSGELWLLMTPRSFSIKVHEGETLTQLRLFNGDTRFSELDLQMAMREHKLLWHAMENVPVEYEDIPVSDHNGSMILTVGLHDKIVGFEARATDEVIETKNIGGYDASDFFQPITLENDRVHLKKDRFYILTTYERVRIPPGFASEMVAMEDRFGDFRSHYAGFLDPGWGWGVMGEGFGRPFTLEVRPFEDLYVRHQQPIANIRFEHLLEEPDLQYDTRASNYLTQTGPRLAKQFRA